MECSLSKQDKILLAQIVCDNETGNHLLGRPRSEEYWVLRDEIFVAEKTMTPCQRQVELLEFKHQMLDYDYWKSLPVEKRLYHNE